MVTLNSDQRRQYEARNRRLLAAVRAGVLCRLIAERFGVNRHRVSPPRPCVSDSAPAAVIVWIGDR